MTPHMSTRWIDAGKVPQDWFDFHNKKQMAKDDKHCQQILQISELHNVLCDAATKLHETV